MKQREFPDVDTSKNAMYNKGEPAKVKNVTEDDGLPVPLSVVRWVCYAAIFFCLLIPFHLQAGQWICGALILGQFASQLNAIIKKP
jgi:hypothetical protein